MAKLATAGNDELADILDAIYAYSRNGNRSLNVDGEIKTTTKTELEKRGFKVECGGRYNEIDTCVRW